MILLAVVLPVAACAPPLTMQSDQIQASDIVRAYFDGMADQPVDGFVSERTSEGLLIRARGSESASQILFLDLTRLRVQRPPNRFLGALSGAGIGILAGVLLGVALNGVSDGPAFAPVGGALIGAPVGLAAGAIVAPTRWAEVRFR
jgi:hypothetical protein